MTAADQHIREATRCAGNAAAYEDDARRSLDVAITRHAAEWAAYWRERERMHMAEAKAMCVVMMAESEGG